MQYGTIWSNFADFFLKPENTIVSVFRYPFNITSVANSTEFMNPIVVGDVQMKYKDPLSEVDETVSGNKLLVTSNEVIDMGSYKFEEYFGSFLDYSPYTKINMFLPYCGFIQLQAENVMGKTVSLKYSISFVDGTCLAQVSADNVPIVSKEFQLATMLSFAINWPLS